MEGYLVFTQVVEVRFLVTECSHSETAITTVYETVILASNPSGSLNGYRVRRMGMRLQISDKWVRLLLYPQYHCSYGVMVTQVVLVHWP